MDERVRWIARKTYFLMIERLIDQSTSNSQNGLFALGSPGPPFYGDFFKNTYFHNCTKMFSAFIISFCNGSCPETMWHVIVQQTEHRGRRQYLSSIKTDTKEIDKVKQDTNIIITFLYFRKYGCFPNNRL